MKQTENPLSCKETMGAFGGSGFKVPKNESDPKMHKIMLKINGKTPNRKPSEMFLWLGA